MVQSSRANEGTTCYIHIKSPPHLQSSVLRRYHSENILALAKMKITVYHIRRGQKSGSALRLDLVSFWLDHGIPRAGAVISNPLYQCRVSMTEPAEYRSRPEVWETRLRSFHVLDGLENLIVHCTGGGYTLCLRVSK